MQAAQVCAVITGHRSRDSEGLPEWTSHYFISGINMPSFGVLKNAKLFFCCENNCSGSNLANVRLDETLWHKNIFQLQVKVEILSYGYNLAFFGMELHPPGFLSQHQLAKVFSKGLTIHRRFQCRVNNSVVCEEADG